MKSCSLLSSNYGFIWRYPDGYTIKFRMDKTHIAPPIVFALAFAVWTWLVLRGSLHDLAVDRKSVV